MPSVWLIDSDLAFAKQLQQAALNQGLRVEQLGDEATILQRLSLMGHLSNAMPSAILVNLNLETNQAQTNQEQAQPISGEHPLLRQLKTLFPTILILVLVEKDEIEERIAAVRLGGDRCILKMAAIDQTCKAIAQVLLPREITAKVLIVDDDLSMLQTLTALLQPWGLQVTALSDPKQFWQILTINQPDVLLLDLEMPTFNGIELCQVVRQDPHFSDLPILVVTGHTDVQSIQQVFMAGADDFIGKPLAGPELVTRVLNRVERSRMQKQLMQFQRQQHPSSDNALAQFATRSQLYQFLDQQWQRLIALSSPDINPQLATARPQRGLALILMSINGFERYIDQRGEAAKAQCLQQIADLIQSCIKPSYDLVACYRENEFAIVLTHTGIEGAVHLAEQLQASIQHLLIDEVNPGISVNLGITSAVPGRSIVRGVSGESDRAPTKSPTESLIALADQALHAAKLRGDNAYCLYPL
jgi:diguanylate cyclase (GGDEF)-like protein